MFCPCWLHQTSYFCVLHHCHATQSRIKSLHKSFNKILQWIRTGPFHLWKGGPNFPIVHLQTICGTTVCHSRGWKSLYSSFCKPWQCLEATSFLIPIIHIHRIYTFYRTHPLSCHRVLISLNTYLCTSIHMCISASYKILATPWCWKESTPLNYFNTSHSHCYFTKLKMW